jgi:HAD superfamily hydrolase (TIGR01509 family)
MTQIKAIIFDLDGVLLPTNIFHRESLVESIKGITGIDTSGNPLVSEHSMLSSKLKIKNVQELYKFSENLCHVILSNKDNIFFSKLANTQPANNVIECLDAVRLLGIKTAIASNSRLNNMERVLEMTDLRKYFDAVVSAEEVNFPKPSPDVLFRAYSKLGLHVNEYSETIFVDDTEEGAEAGHCSPSIVVKINSPDDLSIDLFKEWL